jgi:hypothetical protein
LRDPPRMRGDPGLDPVARVKREHLPQPASAGRQRRTRGFWRARRASQKTEARTSHMSHATCGVWKFNLWENSSSASWRPLPKLRCEPLLLTKVHEAPDFGVHSFYRPNIDDALGRGRRPRRTAKRGFDDRNNGSGTVDHVMLPDAKHTPTRRFESRCLPPITLDVLAQLPNPKLLPAPRANVVVGATMPEASVNKDRELPPREYYVGTPEGGPRVKTIPHTGGPERRPKKLLWGGVLAPYAGHLL